MGDGGKSRSSSPWFHFTAGLGSGCLSAILLQPADLLKTRVQQSGSSSLLATIRELSRGPQPLRQFWRGTLPSTLRTGIGSALYFSSLNALRQHVARSALLTSTGLLVTEKNVSSKYSSSLPKLSNLANLTTGAIARASVGFVMMPITVIKVRYESNYYAYRSLWSASADIFRNEGIKGLFSGFGATAIRDAPYAGLYVVFYEQCKTRLSLLSQAAPATGSGTQRSQDVMKSSTSAPINFASGVIAAGLATAITNPFDAIKTRLQLLPEKYGNTIQAGTLMIKEEGVRSLFDGLGLRIARKAMSSALAWTLYEELIRRAEEKLQDSRQSAL
ncbi:MAG: hypothetical protein M1827_006517 [Pycnora praestabilis]|nr:MAG: hypothetical protein M1827_006517 [Pycnora praestabilis]